MSNKKCRNCGVYVPQNARFCPECGTELPGKKDQKVGTEVQKPESEKKLIKGTGLLLGIAAIALLIVSLYIYPFFTAPHGQGQQMDTQAQSQQPLPQMDQNTFNTLKAAVDENPNNPDANVQLGNFLFDSHRFHDAIPYYLQALKMDPRNADVLVDAGVCYFNVQNYPEAKDYFARALKINGSHINALYNMGIVSAQLGDMQDLKNSWAKLIEVAPNSQAAQNAKQMLDDITKN